MDLFERLLELSQEGFFCSQIILKLAMEEEGVENEGVIRAMSGLNGGLGFSGRLCGALTGGCCLLGYYAGKGSEEEVESGYLNEMIVELVEWFEETIGTKYGGNECHCILEGNPMNKVTRCPHIVAAVYNKVMEMLHERKVI